MFTGIVQQTGEIKKIEQTADITAVSISYEKKLKLEIGDSLSLNGICSTVTEFSDKIFEIEFMPETLKRTTACKWKKGDKINIESSLRLADKLNGHFVTGHIDATGKIIDIKSDDSTKELKITYPENLAKYIAFKGSITVDGVSLTISYLDEDCFSVSLIPHTLINTNLNNKKINNEVNIEVDIISRYLKRLFDERDKQSNYEFLKQRGFI